MGQRFSPQLLRRLRNDLPIEQVVVEILQLPNKKVDGYVRFLCPLCSDFHTAMMKNTNLARCFRCNKNFNPIDLVMTVTGLNFVDAVYDLKKLLLR